MEIRRRPPNPKVQVAHLEFAVPDQDGEPRNFLEKIVWEKDREIAVARERMPLEQLRRKVAELPPARDFLAGKEPEDHRPHRFIDSDLYKVMEGAAYLLQLRQDPELESKLNELADVISGAQETNGYLYPSHTTGVGEAKNMMGDSPYTFVVHSHELYNVGHLYEAAIAYYQATGNKKLLNVAEKSAQHINQVFFSGDPKYDFLP